ncbi:Mur ligase domain-containing protein, partial [Rhizobium phaseoli]
MNIDADSRGADRLQEGKVHSMKLRDLAGDLFPELEAQLEGPAGLLDISGLSSDSRNVAPGNAFVAVAGTKADGAGFIADAAGRGAAVAIASQPVDASIPVLAVKEPRRFLSIAAARCYGRQPE